MCLQSRRGVGEGQTLGSPANQYNLVAESQDLVRDPVLKKHCGSHQNAAWHGGEHPGAHGPRANFL